MAVPTATPNAASAAVSPAAKLAALDTAWFGAQGNSGLQGSIHTEADALRAANPGLPSGGYTAPQLGIHPDVLNYFASRASAPKPDYSHVLPGANPVTRAFAILPEQVGHAQGQAQAAGMEQGYMMKMLPLLATIMQRGTANQFREMSLASLLQERQAMDQYRQARLGMDSARLALARGRAGGSGSSAQNAAITHALDAYKAGAPASPLLAPYGIQPGSTYTPPRAPLSPSDLLNTNLGRVMTANPTIDPQAALDEAKAMTQSEMKGGNIAVWKVIEAGKAAGHSDQKIANDIASTGNDPAMYGLPAATATAPAAATTSAPPSSGGGLGAWFNNLMNSIGSALPSQQDAAH